MSEINEARENWRLDKLSIEFQRYGEDKGKYTGSIRFQNGEFESFSFNVRPDMAQPYIDLIAEDIVKAASNLGERLLLSLGLPKEGDK
jgi:hypothetical protein